MELTDETTGEMLILDAGSGIVGLSESLSGDPRNLPVLLSHYHWDHVQGIPFLATLYRPGWSSTIWAPVLDSHDGAWMHGIFKRPFFPISVEQLPNQPHLEDVHQGSFTIGAFAIRALRVNHPGGAFAYRIQGSAGDLVYASDVELGQPAFDDALGAFVRGAREVVIDAHFTPEEGPLYQGWGHSTWLQAAQFAERQDVERIWLFHHKPGRSDADLDRIAVETKTVFRGALVAAEGESFEV